LEIDLIVHWINSQEASMVFYFDEEQIIGLFHMKLFIISQKPISKVEGLINFQAQTLSQVQFKFQNFDAQHSSVLSFY